MRSAERKTEGKVDVVLGTQWGDEGKGKIIDFLAQDYRLVARPAGGPNAGHTIQVGKNTYHLHGLPEGALHSGTLNVIGPGAVVDPEKLVIEIEEHRVADHLLIISHNTHLITPVHRSLDEIREATEGKRQGSTKAGIAYVTADKYRRDGIPLTKVSDVGSELYEPIVAALEQLQSERAILGLSPHQPELEADQWLVAAKLLIKYADDVPITLNTKLKNGENILVSGAQGHWLDIDEQPYPYGSSTHTGIGGVISGLQIPPQSLDRIIGVMKAFKSRVGDGPVVTEIQDSYLAGILRGTRDQADAEYGKTSKRPRRIAYLDLPEIRRSIVTDGINELALAKVDLLRRFGKSMLVAEAYRLPGEPELIEIAPNIAAELEVAEPVWSDEIHLWNESQNDQIKNAALFNDLPKRVRKFIKFLEERLEKDIKLIGTGPERSQIIVR